MKRLFAIIIISALFLSFAIKSNNKVKGHWVSDNEFSDLKANDTLTFTKIKYSDKLYQWGGALQGIEFAADSNFMEFHNVYCSSETNPVHFQGEKWSVNNGIVNITGFQREMDWKVIGIKNKKLTIVVLKATYK